MTLFSPGDCTLQCDIWIWNRDSEFTKCQRPAMWYVALGWHAIEFARWQHPAIWHLALETWHWIRQVAAPCSVTGGSGMKCHWIRPNVCHIGILHLVTAVDMSFNTSLRNFIQVGPPSAEINDAISIFKMADLSHLGFYGSNNGFFEKPNYITSYSSSLDTIALNCLVFEKIAFLHFGVKIQDGGSSPSWILGVRNGFFEKPMYDFL